LPPPTSALVAAYRAGDVHLVHKLIHQRAAHPSAMMPWGVLELSGPVDVTPQEAIDNPDSIFFSGMARAVTIKRMIEAVTRPRASHCKGSHGAVRTGISR